VACQELRGAASWPAWHRASPRTSSSRGSMRSSLRTAPTPIRRSSPSRGGGLARQAPGGHCKSLFLKDKRAGLWLVVALEERQIDLKRLAAALAAPRFSFGNAALLYEALGVRPGSVTRLPSSTTPSSGSRSCSTGRCSTVTAQLHPLDNDRTTAIAPADLLRFIAGAATGRASSISTRWAHERQVAAALVIACCCRMFCILSRGEDGMANEP